MKQIFNDKENCMGSLQPSVTVFIEGTCSTAVAYFMDEELYDACAEAIEVWAKNKGVTITETVHA